jgi:hypothetical protein
LIREQLREHHERVVRVQFEQVLEWPA